MLNIALPKGRLGDKVYDMLAAAGYDCPGYYEQNRKLVFESPEKNVRYLLVKPSDVAIYVEHHAADVGIVGKDILLEQGSDVYELLDLNIGKCRMAVAAPEGYVEDKNRTLRVATKYVNITKEFYAGRNREIDIIKLNGSIELAPLLGLTDVIVDIVETGSTLRENGLKVLEEVEIGHPAVSKIEPGTCAYVPTGGMVPEGADAMVMVEYSERFGTDEVALYENVPYGKCIVLPGEDVKTGDIVLKAGTRIGPAQAGTLAALGVVQVPVFKPWKVAVLSTGDELVRIDQVPGPGQVRDINTWALSCYVKKTGLELVSAEAVKDEEVLLEEKIREAVKACDLILISGGSSQGKKDMTMEILNRISKEGVFTHGLALKPGKPTILGYDKEKHTLLGGLPGHPAAALAVFHLLFVWLWKQVTGQPDQPPLEAFMTTNLAGAPGKTTCLLVKLQMAPQGLEAEPVFGKSGLISTMAEADGYVLIDMNQEGLKKGEQVKVYRF